MYSVVERCHGHVGVVRSRHRSEPAALAARERRAAAIQAFEGPQSRPRLLVVRELRDARLYIGQLVML